MFYVLFLLGILSQIGHTKDESNSFLVWARQYAQDVRDDPSWVCGPLPASNHSRLPWWVSPLQGNDWRKLRGYIHEAQAESMVLHRATRSDVSQWPINMTLNQKGHGKKVSKRETDAIVRRFSKSFLSKGTSLAVIRNKNHRYKDGYFQIWDEQLWLTASLGRLSQVAPICWEQPKPVDLSLLTVSKFVGWIPSGQCQHTVILQTGHWLASDWSSRHGVSWAAPNGTQWLCGQNLWPWLPPGWVGRCTLGFPWMQGRWTKALHLPAHLSVSPHRMGHRALQRHKASSSNSAPSMGLQDVVWHINSLAQYLDKVLNHTSKEISLLSVEVQLMRKAALQRQMAQDTMKAAKAGKCAVLKDECCVYLPKDKHVRPGLTSFVKIVWGYFSETSGWKCLVTLAGFLKLLLVGTLLVQIVLTFISSNFWSIHMRMLLFHAHPVTHTEPTAPPPELEYLQEYGP